VVGMLSLWVWWWWWVCCGYCGGDGGGGGGFVVVVGVVVTLLYTARYQYGTYRVCCSRMDAARTSVKTGSWTGRTHWQ
jgi:hypothetical protein